jgi:ABC-type Fe3+/spermidine/putrescine transport system ATPase subunit
MDPGTAVTLACRNLTKRYADNSGFALGRDDNGVSFDVQKGELFALLGPSGCGKTTTLRIIGGFVTPTSGSVEIDGRDVTRVPPYRRPTNMVFQSYALFPHMSLGANVEFGLAMDRVPRRERRQRASETLELVGLGGQEKRRVTELSGGESQRAALARAMVKRPALLLLDEPLGALDLKLRQEMQREIVHLKLTTGTTFVHVTHDQEEACAMADRIAVMRNGDIIQIDTPVALYRAPRTAYVADFINAGTLIRGSTRRDGQTLQISTPDVIVKGPVPAQLNGTTKFAAVIPRDCIRLSPSAVGGAVQHVDAAEGIVESVAFTGSVYEVVTRISESLGLAAAVRIDDAADPHALEVGTRVRVSWRPEDVVFVEDV